MRTTLNWLHISDIHFNSKTAWRDKMACNSLIDYLRTIFTEKKIEKPDLVFCTGDIAFGETGASPLTDQYKEAASFLMSFYLFVGRVMPHYQKNGFL